MLTFNRSKRQKTFEINCEYDCFLFIRNLKEIYFKIIFHEFLPIFTRLFYSITKECEFPFPTTTNLK